jgi:hypothetical protein
MNTVAIHFLYIGVAGPTTPAAAIGLFIVDVRAVAGNTVHLPLCEEILVNGARKLRDLFQMTAVAGLGNPFREVRFVSPVDIMAGGAVHHIGQRLTQDDVAAPLDIFHGTLVTCLAHGIDGPR